MTIATEDPRLSPENIDFFALAREDTGRHLLDSGGHYGRHHEKPDVPEDSHVIERRGDHLSDLRINTPAFLTAWHSVDRDLQAAFQRFAEHASNRQSPWSELVEVFLNGQGYKQVSSGNPYNVDNDLSQVYTFSTWVPMGFDGDWVYAGQTAVTVYRMHNGCDVRGGYSRPLFTRVRGEYTDTPYPFTVTIGARTLAARFATDVTLSDSKRTTRKAGERWEGPPWQIDDMTDPFQRWTCHYSRAPLYMMEQDVDRIFWHTWNDTKKTVVVRTNEGHIAKVFFYSDGPDGLELGK